MQTNHFYDPRYNCILSNNIYVLPKNLSREREPQNLSLKLLWPWTRIHLKHSKFHLRLQTAPIGALQNHHNHVAACFPARGSDRELLSAVALFLLLNRRRKGNTGTDSQCTLSCMLSFQPPTSGIQETCKESLSPASHWNQDTRDLIPLLLEVGDQRQTDTQGFLVSKTRVGEKDSLHASQVLETVTDY